MKKEKFCESIVKKFEELTYRIENNEHSEEKLLRTELNKHKALKKISISLTECHMIAGIGDQAGTNGAALSKALNITKGGVSKTAAKLISKGLISAERLPNNKKEVHYTLTALGNDLYVIHGNMHEEAKSEFISGLKKMSTGDLGVIETFLENILRR